MSNDGKMSNKKYFMLATLGLAAVGFSLYLGSKPVPVPKPSGPVIPLPAISNATVISATDNKLINITFPYRRPGVDDEKLDFNFTVTFALGEASKFHITPDDCVELLEINDKPVELTGDALAQHCNWQNGFTMDWKPYLHNGANKVHVVIRNIKGWTGLYVLPVH